MYLKVGSRGKMVKKLQHALNEKGYEAGVEDGIFGKGTKAAVVDYQRDEDLTIDGIVGPETIKELGLDQRPEDPNTLVEVHELTNEEKLHMIDAMSVFEGNFWTCNKDGEYQGWFDAPRKTLEGKKLHPRDRRSYAEANGLKWKALSWSQYTDNPGHVGLSWGFVQFTQDGGNLGVLLKRIRAKHPALFDEVFGSHAKELVRVTCLRGAKVVTPDGRRSPRVHPIGGKDLWEQPWVGRFVKAGKIPEFQTVQMEQAVALYFNAMLKKTAIPFGFKSQKALTILVDRSIQLGPTGCKNLIKRHIKGKENWSEPDFFDYLYKKVRSRGWSHRLKKLIASDELSWYRIYDLEDVG